MAVLSGFKWADPNVTVSIMPDGTKIDSFVSNLNAIYTDALASTLASALARWSDVSALEFGMIADAGLPRGTFGKAQGDSRFGDIRIGGYPSPNFWLGVAAYPSAWSAKGGDIILNTARVTLERGNLLAVLLHELGHAIGLAHCSIPDAVMYNAGKTELHPDDVSGVQQIYGAPLLVVDLCELDEMPFYAVKCMETEA